MVVLRVVRVLVHAEHDGDILVFPRSGDDDLLSSRFQVFRSAIAVTEEARCFNDNVDTELGQWQCGRSPLAEDLDLVPVDHHRTVLELNRPWVGPMHGIVL